MKESTLVQSGDQGSAEGHLELRDAVAVVWRRRHVVAISVAVVLITALLMTFRQTPQYRATAELLVRSEPSGILMERQDGRLDSERAVNNEIRVIESAGVRDAVVAAYSGDLDVEDVRASATSDDSDVIAVSVTAADAEAARDLVDQYSRTYIEYRRERRMAELLAAGGHLQEQADALQAQISEIRAPLTAVEAEIAATGGGGALEARRQQVASEVQPRLSPLQAQLAFYQQQLDEVQLSTGLAERGGVELLSPADVSDGPVSPVPVRNAVVALTLGLMLGVALAFLIDYFDDGIRSKEELGRLSGGLPLLGQIPVVNGWRNPDQAQVVSVSEPSSPPAEAYRTLRTSLQFMGLERSVAVTQFTSPHSADGKSTTLVNLAVALARAGQRVIMVDCDLRRPRLHKFFDVDNHAGFSSVLLGGCTLESALRPVPEVPRLALLPSGPPPPNPSELLASTFARKVFEELRGQCDFLLVDSPPVLPVTDAHVLSGIVDATVMVASAHRTPRAHLRRAVEVLGQVGAPIIGTVLNRVPDSGGYGYRYSRRGYTYSQGSDARRGGWRPGRSSVAPADAQEPTRVPSL